MDNATPAWLVVILVVIGTIAVPPYLAIICLIQSISQPNALYNAQHALTTISVHHVPTAIDYIATNASALKP